VRQSGAGLGVGVSTEVDQDSPVVGALLRRHRLNAGLSQEELAVAATISARSVSDLERGVSRTARPHTARLLANALGLGGQERTRFLAMARGQVPPDEPPSAVGGPTTFAATRSLPRDIAGFTGRAGELDWLVTRLASSGGGGRVVGICAIGGMAGVGKTTLAVHAAHQLAAGYPDGQFFLPLHGHTPGHRPADPADALGSLLLAAGVPARQIPPGLEPRAARWRDFLAGKKVLLVLDDAAGHEQVEPLLPGTGGSTVLVTSRRRLGALSDAAVISLDTLTADDAADMLARLAGRLGLKSGDPVVTELTRLCGYLPLAIGLLASQLRHHPAWTLEDLSGDLTAERDKLALMQAESLSVEAALSLSYRDLTAQQRRLFRRLGLHPGSDIDVHAAAAVSGLSVATARRQLAAVYDQHLLNEPRRGRYRMHDLVREHARALAAADDVGTREAAVDRLMEYYMQTALVASSLMDTRILNYSGAPPAGVAPACAPKLTTADEATAWMQAEEANLRAVAETAAATGRVQPATLIPAAMAQFLYVQGRWQDAIALHGLAAAAAYDAGDSVGYVRAIWPLVHMQNMAGDYSGALANLNQILNLVREIGDQAGEAEALEIMGLVYVQACNFPRAKASCLEALKLARDIGTDHGVAQALAIVGGVYLATGDLLAAAASSQQARDLFRLIGETVGEAQALTQLALVDILIGEFADASSALDEVGPMVRDLGEPYFRGWLLHATGILRRHTGRHREAVSSHEAAIEQFDALSLVNDAAYARNELGLTLQRTGDLTAAAAAHREALAELRNWPDPYGEAAALNSLGELSLLLGATAESQHYHAQAKALARKIGARLEEARALEGIGRCFLSDGRTADGTNLLRQALAVYRRAGAAAAGPVEETLASLSLDRYNKPPRRRQA
jgi:tetratricopeptide (TPR) repeat protein/DNA-binding XRE family transcriptional regulator